MRALSSRVTLLARSGLQSRPQLGIFAKFAPLFAKLAKLQTPNAKPLDTSFGVFGKLLECKPQMQNLEDTLIVQFTRWRKKKPHHFHVAICYSVM